MSTGLPALVIGLLSGLLFVGIPTVQAAPEPMCQVVQAFIEVHTTLREHGHSLEAGMERILTDLSSTARATLPADVLGTVLVVTGKNVYFNDTYHLGSQLNGLLVEARCARLGFDAYWNELRSFGMPPVSPSRTTTQRKRR